MRLIDYVSEPRWCGRCGEPVLPVSGYVDRYGRMVATPGRAICPDCHHDVRTGPHNPGLVSPVRAMEDARRI